MPFIFYSKPNAKPVNVEVKRKNGLVDKVLLEPSANPIRTNDSNLMALVAAGNVHGYTHVAPKIVEEKPAPKKASGDKKAETK